MGRILKGEKMKFLLYTLFLTATWEGVLYVTLAGFNLRPYMLILSLVVLFLLYEKRFKLDRVNLCLIFYVISGIPSLINSRSIEDTVITLFFQGVMVVIALSVRVYLNSIEKLEKAIGVWLVITANVVNVFGWIQAFSWIVGHPISPHFHPELYAIYRPYSFFIEPNFYGNFLASQLTMLTVIWISPVYKTLSRKFFVTIIFALPLFILNQSRGPWLGYVFALAAFMFFRYLVRRKMSTRFIATSVALLFVFMTASLLIYAARPDIGAAFLQRIQETINPLGEGSASDRMYEMQTSLRLTRNHPIFGHGIGTWGLYLTANDIGVREGRAIRTSPRNIFLSWLFEGGTVRFLAGVAFVILLLQRVKRALQTPDASIKTLVWACFVGWLAVFFTFQFTVLEISPFYWIVIGLLLSATDRGIESHNLCRKLALT